MTSESDIPERYRHSGPWCGMGAGSATPPRATLREPNLDRRAIPTEGAGAQLPEEIEPPAPGAVGGPGAGMPATRGDLGELAAPEDRDRGGDEEREGQSVDRAVVMPQLAKKPSAMSLNLSPPITDTGTGLAPGPPRRPARGQGEAESDRCPHPRSPGQPQRGSAMGRQQSGRESGVPWGAPGGAGCRGREGTPIAWLRAGNGRTGSWRGAGGDFGGTHRCTAVRRNDGPNASERPAELQAARPGEPIQGKPAPTR